MSRANPLTTHSNAGIAVWKFKLRAEIHSFEDCEKFLMDSAEYRELDCQPMPERDLGPHMLVIAHGGMFERYYAVKLYDTEIIRYYPDGTFSVDNGGFNTLTTTARLSAVLPDGYAPAYHRDKKLGVGGYAPDRVTAHWPCDHSVRIDPAREG
jgi:hypothetical protein